METGKIYRKICCEVLTHMIMELKSPMTYQLETRESMVQFQSKREFLRSRGADVVSPGPSLKA